MNSIYYNKVVNFLQDSSQLVISTGSNFLDQSITFLTDKENQKIALKTLKNYVIKIFPSISINNTFALYPIIYSTVLVSFLLSISCFVAFRTKRNQNENHYNNTIPKMTNEQIKQKVENDTEENMEKYNKIKKEQTVLENRLARQMRSNILINKSLIIKNLFVTLITCVTSAVISSINGDFLYDVLQDIGSVAMFTTIVFSLAVIVKNYIDRCSLIKKINNLKIRADQVMVVHLNTEAIKFTQERQERSKDKIHEQFNSGQQGRILLLEESKKEKEGTKQALETRNNELMENLATNKKMVENRYNEVRNSGK